MKLSVSRTSLLSGMKSIAGAAGPERPADEILEHVFLEADDSGRLRLYASDREQAAHVELTTNVSRAGAATASVSRLFGLLRLLPDADLLCLEYKQGKLTLSSGDERRFVLYSFEPVGIDNLIDSTPDPVAVIDSTGLLRLLDETHFAIASASEVRAALTGVFLELDGEKRTARAVATDGSRLSFSSGDCDYDGPGVSGILPRKAVKTLRSWLKRNDGKIEISLGHGFFRADIDGAWFHSRLIDAAYPDYRPFLAESGGEACTVERSAFQCALNQVVITSEPRFKDVLVRLDKGFLTFKSSNKREEDGCAVVDAKVKRVPGVLGAFNGHFLKQAVTVVDTDSFDIDLVGAHSAFLIRPTGRSDSQHLIMPMSLPGWTKD